MHNLKMPHGKRYDNFSAYLYDWAIIAIKNRHKIRYVIANLVHKTKRVVKGLAPSRNSGDIKVLKDSEFE